MRSLFLEYIAQTSPNPMLLEIERGEGIYLFDKQGRKYIDLISGISVSNIGHGNPAIRQAIHEQTDKYLHTMVFGEYVQSPQVKFAQKLTANLPGNLNTVYFVNSGSEAIEGALKLAKKFTGKPNVVAMKNAYHGSSNGTLSLMSDPYFTAPFRPLIPGIRFMELNSEKGMDLIDDQTAAVVVELIQAESGYKPATVSFIQALRQRCDATGALLIFDEIQTGMGRTGKLFAMEHFQVVPDILCLAKAFGGGMPLGAFIAGQKVMKVLMNDPVLGHITTFGGHPVSCAAGLAALEQLTEHEWISQVEAKGNMFRSLLIHPEIQELRGKGLMLSVRLKSAAFLHQVVDNCIRQGLIIDWFLFAEDRLRIAPPLIISEQEIRDSCRIILQSLDQSQGAGIDP